VKDHELDVIRKRLTAEHLTERTMIFKEHGAAGLAIAQRFEQYWKSWVEQDLNAFFRELDKLKPVVPVDYALVPFRHFGKIVQVGARIEDTLFVPIKGGVRIEGPGYIRTVMNSFYDDHKEYDQAH
jgi:hypothetical protein